MADSLVETISVQTHLEYGGIYQTAYTSVVKPKLIELGVRHIRQQMTGQSAIWAKFQELHTDGGITLTAGAGRRAPTTPAPRIASPRPTASGPR
jgi:hypothetical protein